MDRLYLEEPTIDRKEAAIEYIMENYIYNSNINGSGGLDRYLDDYEGWLKKLQEDYTRVPNEEKVPARTYFLVRENDDRIIGMINIRLALNEKLKKYGGNIGYGIRPTERRKGYNKINLYLGLIKCAEYGLEKVLLDADIDNIASWKTMESLGGERIGQYYDDIYSNCEVVIYSIDVNKSLKTYENKYDKYVLRR